MMDRRSERRDSRLLTHRSAAVQLTSGSTTSGVLYDFA
jgi:hypothetical protein